MGEGQKKKRGTGSETTVKVLVWVLFLLRWSISLHKVEKCSRTLWGYPGFMPPYCGPASIVKSCVSKDVRAHACAPSQDIFF